MKEVNSKLESLMSEIEQLVSISTLPEKVDTKFWENFVIQETERHILKLFG